MPENDLEQDEEKAEYEGLPPHALVNAAAPSEQEFQETGKSGLRYVQRIRDGHFDGSSGKVMNKKEND